MTKRRGLPPEAGGRDGPDRRGIIGAALRMTDAVPQPSLDGTPMSPAPAGCGPTVTRFAPSPTGYLHLGHVRSALEGWRAAREAGGRFLLRIEDIDHTRCRAEYTEAIIEDLRWLGLDWDGPIRRQSEHFDDYRAALSKLDAMGLLYPCFCTRREIQAEIARAGGAPQGDLGALYPGICRSLSAAEREARIQSAADYALRLDIGAALARTGPLYWDEHETRVAAEPAVLGDVVLARKEVPT